MSFSGAPSTVGSGSSSEWYREYADEDSWYEWNSEYTSGPDAHLVPTGDTGLNLRLRQYRRNKPGGAISTRPSMKERRDMRDLERSAQDFNAGGGESSSRARPSIWQLKSMVDSGAHTEGRNNRLLPHICMKKTKSRTLMRATRKCSLCMSRRRVCMSRGRMCRKRLLCKNYLSTHDFCTNRESFCMLKKCVYISRECVCSVFGLCSLVEFHSGTKCLQNQKENSPQSTNNYYYIWERDASDQKRSGVEKFSEEYSLRTISDSLMSSTGELTLVLHYKEAGREKLKCMGPPSASSSPVSPTPISSSSTSSHTVLSSSTSLPIVTSTSISSPPVSSPLDPSYILSSRHDSSPPDSSRPISSSPVCSSHVYSPTLSSSLPLASSPPVTPNSVGYEQHLKVKAPLVTRKASRRPYSKGPRLSNVPEDTVTSDDASSPESDRGKGLMDRLSSMLSSNKRLPRVTINDSKKNILNSFTTDDIDSSRKKTLDENANPKKTLKKTPKLALLTERLMGKGTVRRTSASGLNAGSCRSTRAELLPNKNSPEYLRRNSSPLRGSGSGYSLIPPHKILQFALSCNPDNINCTALKPDTNRMKTYVLCFFVFYVIGSILAFSSFMMGKCYRRVVG